MVALPPGGREKTHAPPVVASLAARQHGVVARRQLLAAGVSGATIGRLTRAGWLTAVNRGVYAVAGHPHTRRARWMAAVLACGDGALLSHRSAAELWRITEPRGGPVHITVATARHRRPNLILHRHPHPARFATAHHAIPVTTPSRTLLDLATTLGPSALARALDEADRLDLLDPHALTRLCETRPTPRGGPRLHSLLAHHRPLPETRSALERRFLGLVHEAGLPAPATNVPVAGLEVDFLWPDARLVVELDGYAYHHSRARFERDRERITTLQLAGYRVLVLTHRRLANDPEGVVVDLRRALAVPAAG